MDAKRITFIHFSVISITAFILYSYSFKNEFVWDDQSLIRHNDKIHHLSRIPKLFFLDFFDFGVSEGPNQGGYYRPLVMASFALDWAAWGENPAGFHFVNTLLHIANALLLYWLIRRILGPPRVAFWSALLFAIHPLQVDSVAYISGRTDVLAVTFILATLAGLLKGWRAASLFCCAAALASKEIGVAAAPLAFVLLFAVLRRNFWRAFAASLPYFALTAVYLAVRPVILNTPAGELSRYAEGAAWRFLNILPAWAESFRLVLFPHDIHFERFQAVSPVFSLNMGLAAALFILFLAGLIWLWKKSRPLFFFAALYFLPLVPVLQLHPMYVQDFLFWTEHFLYLPLAGLLPVAIWGLLRLAGRFQFGMRAAAALPAVLIPLFCWFSVARIGDWKNEETLFVKALSHNPSSARAHNNLALVYQCRGKIAEAEKHLKKAADLMPESPGAFNNLGNLCKDRGEWDAAIGYYEKAIDRGANTAGVYHNLATAYKSKGMLARAEQVYQHAIPIVKNPHELYNELGMLYCGLGKTPQALVSFQKAIEHQPDFVKALNNAGILLAKSRMHEKAEEYFKRALAWNPNVAETHNNLGNLYLLTGRRQAAEEAYREALRLFPGYEDPLRGLRALADSGEN